MPHLLSMILDANNANANANNTPVQSSPIDARNTPLPQPNSRNIYTKNPSSPHPPLPTQKKKKKLPPMQNGITGRGVYKYNKHITLTQTPPPSPASISTKGHPHLLLASKVLIFIEPGVMCQDAGILGARWDVRGGEGRVGLRFGV